MDRAVRETSAASRVSPILKRFRPRRVIPPEEMEHGLRMLMYDGVSSQVMATLTGGAFLVAFALQLGASPLLIGVIGALQPFTQILQIPSIYLVERLGYRKLFVVGTLTVSRVFSVLLAAVPFALPEGYWMPALIVSLSLFFGFGTISGVAWNPWIRDLIPEERRSRYMAARLAVTTAIGAALSLVAAFGVDWFQAHFESIGIFSLYFALGGAAGLLGVLFVARVPEPALAHNPNIALGQLIAEPVCDRNFRHLLVFLASWNFAVNFAAPFFTVYLLQRLHLSMSVILTLSVLSQAVNVLFFRLWGRLAARFTYKSVLVEAGSLFILTFLMWPLTSFGNWDGFTLPALIFIYMFTGMSTAGVQLSTSNIAMVLAPRGRATAYLAINALVSGIAATVAPLLGGLAATMFEGEALTLTFRWASRSFGWETEFTPFTLHGLDFVFLLAFLFGVYSLHRLALVREPGEAANGTVQQEFQTNVRRAIDHISSMAGLRDLFAFPYARLIELFNRRKSKRIDVE